MMEQLEQLLQANQDNIRNESYAITMSAAMLQNGQKEQNMADKAHRLTDEKLEEMEKRLSAIYSE